MITPEAAPDAGGRDRGALPPAPLFLLGVDRSGTTLLRLMLDAHSRIAIPDESHFIVELYRSRATLEDLDTEAGRRALRKRLLADPRVRRWDVHLTPDDLDLERCRDVPSAVDELFRAYARRCGKATWGDKTPAYTRDVHVLNEMFPSARFIHLVRDGRDVAQSIVRQWWGAPDFASAIAYWSETATGAHKMLRMLPPSRWREIRFEDLAEQPDEVLRGLCAFLGVPYEAQMVDGYRRAASTKVGGRTATYHSGLSDPLDRSRVHRWRRSLSALDQAVAHEIAGSALELFGYPRGATSHPLKLPRLAWFRLRRAWHWRSGRATRAMARVRRGDL